MIRAIVILCAASSLFGHCDAKKTTSTTSADISTTSGLTTPAVNDTNTALNETTTVSSNATTTTASGNATATKSNATASVSDETTTSGDATTESVKYEQPPQPQGLVPSNAMQPDRSFVKNAVLGVAEHSDSSATATKTTSGDNHTENSNDNSTNADQTTTATDNATTTSCTPYPKELKSLEECCKPPIMFDDELVGTCEFLCHDDKKQENNTDCPVNCLLNNNKIVRKGEMNVSAAEIMYDKFGLAERAWRGVTHEALKKCQINREKSASMQEAFNLFEACMKKEFIEHCVETIEDISCDPVEDFMEKCQNIKQDCATWPRWIVKLPESCCNNRPELFNEDLRRDSLEKCGVDTISNLGNMECQATMMLNISGIRSPTGWNFTIAVENLIENSKNDPKWKTAIEKTVATCEKQTHDDEKSGKETAQVDFWFYECIKGSLADFCPEISTSTKKCRRIKKYKEACPESVPPRRSYMNNGRM